MAKSKFLLEFLTKNFKPLFSENELGALGNVATRDDLTKEFGTLPSYEITGDQIREAFGSKFRAIDAYKDKPLPFQRSYTKLVRDPLEGFSMTANVGSLPKDPTLVTDASVLKGKTIIPLVGDRSVRGAEITSIGGKKFEKPVKTYGGVQFMDDSEAAWASDLSPMRSIQNIAQTVQDMGGKPVGMTTTMSERGADFSLDTANLIIESLKASDLSKNKLNKMTKLIKDTTIKGEKPFKKVPNLNNMDEFAKYFRGLPGTTRVEMAKRMDSAQLQEAGAPDIGQIRIAVTNPGMLAEDFLGMGARFVDIDPSLGVLPSKHTTYKSQIMKAPDAETYTFGTNIPRTIMLRKMMENRRATGDYGKFKPMPQDYRGLVMKPQVEQVDQQLIDEASKFLEIQRTLGDEEAYKYAQSLIPAT